MGENLDQTQMKSRVGENPNRIPAQIRIGGNSNWIQAKSGMGENLDWIQPESGMGENPDRILAQIRNGGKSGLDSDGIQKGEKPNQIPVQIRNGEKLGLDRAWIWNGGKPRLNSSPNPEWEKIRTGLGLGTRTGENWEWNRHEIQNVGQLRPARGRNWEWGKTSPGVRGGLWEEPQGTIGTTDRNGSGNRDEREGSDQGRGR
ncbi:hypothetical protein WISP_54333 [Willisornis vidua]|uniref:Uncharacterized protein n=1 Tax=Willisornis vidua TaxID=1566151 RepID=A0ABQ9DIG2_9PASS|nr:hypothetical protein WISP_54333 [Willisornis vidua]